MKKSRLFICIMLSALCIATWSCNKHDDDEEDNPSTPTVTSLAGKTWTYGFDNNTAIIEFTVSTFVMVADNGESTSGTYSYDGEIFSCSFSGDDSSYNMYCLTKSNISSSLEGTVWRFEEVYGSRVYTYTIYLYGNTFTLHEDGHSYQEQGNYAYDGNTLTATFDGETQYLKCGTVLYEMARNNTNIW